MANPSTPTGLVPVKYLDGRAYNGACRPYFVPSSYATDLFVYDPVIIYSGSNTAAVRDHVIAALPALLRANYGSNNLITGPIVGFEPVSGSTPLVYGIKNTDRIAWVADDPSLIFSIRADSYSALSPAVVGKNANFIRVGVGDTSTGISAAQLDSGTIDTPAVNAAFQLAILGIDPDPAQEVGSSATYVKWLVRINKHTYAQSTAGV